MYVCTGNVAIPSVSGKDDIGDSLTSERIDGIKVYELSMAELHRQYQRSIEAAHTLGARAAAKLNPVQVPY